MTGTEEKLCTVFRRFDYRSGSLCFCRFYDHNESACNAYPNMILTATRVLMQDRSDDTVCFSQTYCYVEIYYIHVLQL